MGKFSDVYAEKKSEGYCSLDIGDAIIHVDKSEFDRICEDVKSDKKWIEVTDLIGCEVVVRASIINFIYSTSKHLASIHEADRQDELVKGN